ncbi:MAG: S41 family peptidase [Polyangiaceae bacterium]
MVGFGARWVAGLAALAVSLSAATAVAGDFDERGVYSFAPGATARYDFEDGAPEPVDDQADPISVVSSESALRGSHVVTLGPFQSVDLFVDPEAGQRTYRASVWVRGNDSAGYLVVSHDEENRAVEVVSLYPTGRVTSDGWVELANERIPIDGARSSAVIGVFNPSQSAVEVDAAEVAVDGEVEGVMHRPCDGAADGATCGVGEICLWSECHPVAGWVPPIPEDRDDVTDYLENRLRFIFGPYVNRALDLPAALLALEAMRKATDPWSYWNGFTRAVRLLHDGHTSTSSLAGFVQQNPKPLDVCFLEGEADETSGTAPSDPLYRDVIVSHVGPDHHLDLSPGDRLVSVDGMHPIAWARSLVGIDWSSRGASNHVTFAELASRLRSTISRYAHHIEVIRCGSTPGSCGEVEVIDVSAIAFDGPDTMVSGVACDNRPLRHLADSPADHSGGTFKGKLLDAQPSEAFYGLEWESLYVAGNQGVGPELSAAVQLFKSEGATGVILDHRTGNGGTINGPSILWSWAVPTHDVSYMRTRPFDAGEQPSLAEGLAIYQAGLAAGDAQVAGSSNPTTIPIALLLTEDVSASDWLPLGMKGAAPNVRLFGPYETNGGFSTRYQFGYWYGITYVLATADTFLPDGSTTNGRGVMPDVVVAPKQSDLMQGIDTVFEAALSWLRQEAM